MTLKQLLIAPAESKLSKKALFGNFFGKGGGQLNFLFWPGQSGLVKSTITTLDFSYVIRSFHRLFNTLL